MNLSESQIELLAPAGCYASLQAAIDAGADAVYFGLAQLNMRARSRRSFHLEDLPEIMSRCKSAGIRGYLTLNTLLYDHDLKLCYELLETAKAHGVDAVIAADMACIQKARELGLECHLSTQLSVSNFESFKFYAQFCDRIVLARELNLSMIAKIRRQVLERTCEGPPAESSRSKPLPTAHSASPSPGAAACHSTPITPRPTAEPVSRTAGRVIP